MTYHPPAPSSSDPDRGAVLVLAMVFLLAIALVAVATAGLAVGAGANTSNSRVLQSSQAEVESEVSLAIADARSKYVFTGCSGDSCYGNPSTLPTPTFSSLDDCTPSSSAGGLSSLKVVCQGTGGSKYQDATRTVDFYVCSASISMSSCATSNPPKFVLYAEVTFQDLPAGAAESDNQCTSTASPPVCGITATINSWDVRLADI